MKPKLSRLQLHKFLQTRERGALFANADFIHEKHPNEPAFDWLIFDDIQESMDKTLQESVAHYNPAIQVIVFVFLPSKSGNSVAMWRRKINVPNNTRLMLQREINLAMAGLRKREDYTVYVDEYVLTSSRDNLANLTNTKVATQKGYAPTSSSAPSLTSSSGLEQAWKRNEKETQMVADFTV